jgi:hypothetical protein
MRLPANYNRRLQRTFPDMRVRWSNQQECWLLEGRANYTRIDVDPEKYPVEAIDTFVQHRDGYFQFDRIAPNGLPPVDRLIAALCANDTQRMDLGPGDDIARGARLAEQYEQRDAGRREAEAHTHRYDVRSAAKELYEDLAREEGRRVFVPAGEGSN